MKKELNDIIKILTEIRDFLVGEATEELPNQTPPVQTPAVKELTKEDVEKKIQQATRQPEMIAGMEIMEETLPDGEKIQIR